MGGSRKLACRRCASLQIWDTQSLRIMGSDRCPSVLASPSPGHVPGAMELAMVFDRWATLAHEGWYGLPQRLVVATSSGLSIVALLTYVICTTCCANLAIELLQISIIVVATPGEQEEECSTVSSSKRIQTQLDQLLTVQELRRGFNGVTAVTIHTWRHTKDLPTIVVRGTERDSIRFYLPDVQRWAKQEGRKLDLRALRGNRRGSGTASQSAKAA